MADANDHEHMAEALRLAANGLYDTAPNPTVGCVLVKDGRVVGTGWTAPAGGPHAERVALAAAGAAARGATAYVTLEPCCHTGRTGPCTNALIEAGVARVVFAGHDPNPRVGGGGARELAAAGIAVEGGVLEDAAEPLNRGFFARMRRGLPWVRSKLAVSLDGRTALANGVSQWITSASARGDVHRWRARSSAVLTGSGTIVDDDPSLDARREEAGIDAAIGIKQPLRAIVDSRLRTPPTARTLALPGEVLVLTTRSVDEPVAVALRDAGARVETRRRQRGALRPCAPCSRGSRSSRSTTSGSRRAPVSTARCCRQGSSTSSSSIWRRGCSATRRAACSPCPPLTTLAAGWPVTFDDVRRIGPDLRITARVSRVAGA